MQEDPFDQTDQKLIKIMEQLDVHHSLAKTIMYLSKGGDHRATDIEKEVGLRQPEVSKATNELYRLGWIERTKEMKIGKGRPIYHYHLNKDVDEILFHFQQKKQEEIDRIQQVFKEIEENKLNKEKLN